MEKEKFWFIWNPSTNFPNYRHESLMSAELKATRLAKLNPGCEFVILEAIQSKIIEEPIQTIQYVNRLTKQF